MGSLEELGGRPSALAARLDAQTRLMEALRETQVEDHEQIAELRQGLVTFERRFDGLERGQGMILDLLRRRNGEEPPASAE